MTSDLRHVAFDDENFLTASLSVASSPATLPWRRPGIGHAPSINARSANVESAGLMEVRAKGAADPMELADRVARLEELLRQRPIDIRETMLRVGPLELDLIDRNAKRSGRMIELLPREFGLLKYMMRQHDQLLTCDTLLEQVWNYKFIPKTSNVVHVHMGRLHRKIDGPGEARMIHNVRGAGFILRTPD
jgi:DNA-binding response OmpR family regulator